MNDKNEEIQEMTESKFLHDLCNPLAVVFANLKMSAVKLESDPNNVDIAVEKINKALKNFERINTLINQRREFIRKNNT